MKKLKLPAKTVTIFTVICALLAFISACISLFLPLYLNYKFNNIDTRNASSIGIIGGADGPTAVILSGNSFSLLVTAFFSLLTILGLIYLLIARYKKKHNL